MKTKPLYLGTLLISVMATAQVGINTTDPKVTLQIDHNAKKSTSEAGIIIPRLGENPEKGIANGQLIYNTSENQFFYWNGKSWLPIAGQTLSNVNNHLNAEFIDSRKSQPITLQDGSAEVPVTGVVAEFTLDKAKPVQFQSTVNFMGTSSAFAPLFKLKLTNLNDNTSEIIDQASNTFLSDGLSQYYGNLALMTIKQLKAGNYKAEIIAHYNDCCDFDFKYIVGGKDTPVSLFIQYP